MLQRLENTRQAEALHKKKEAKDCAVQTKRKAAAAACAIPQAEKGQAQSAKAVAARTLVASADVAAAWIAGEHIGNAASLPAARRISAGWL